MVRVFEVIETLGIRGAFDVTETLEIFVVFEFEALADEVAAF